MIFRNAPHLILFLLWIPSRCCHLAVRAGSLSYVSEKHKRSRVLGFSEAWSNWGFIFGFACECDNIAFVFDEGQTVQTENTSWSRFFH